MVSWRLTLLLLLIVCMPTGIHAFKPKVVAEIDAARTSELRRIEGRIYVWRLPQIKVDPKGFELEKKPLVVEFVKDRPLDTEEIRADPDVDPDTVISIYRFQLPGKPRGLYILSPITAVIDGQKYKSMATTYEVTTAQASSSLELEASIEGEAPFYPGQHTTFTYKIFYNRDIELTEEYLPLLDAEGFQKVGQKEIKDSQTDAYTVQEISQQVRAIDPGSWTYGPSVIEGAAYEEDAQGKRRYDKQHLRATALAISVKVDGFPIEGKPASFTGAVGKYAIKARLITPNKINMGEKVEVGVRITGSSDLADLTMPDISCQPGFSGFFQIGDYPYYEQRDNLSKEFIITLRPLSTHITEIPQMEYAYFDPKKREYIKVHSESIPLEVRPLVSVKPESRSGRPEDLVEKYGPKEDQSPGLLQHNKGVTGVDWRIWLGKPGEVKLAEVYPLTAKDLVSSPWTFNQVWMAIGILVSLLLLEIVAKRFRRARPLPPRVLHSEDYLALAAQNKHDPAKMSSFIEEAFLLLLVEKGWYTKKVRSPEYLVEDGSIGQVRSFLFDMDSKRFGGLEAFVPREILRSAKQLYRTIRYGRG